MKPIHWILLVIGWCNCIGSLQGQSCCDRDTIITLCYFSSEDYCVQAQNDGGCPHYYLDGNFMEAYLKEKLSSPDNFGSNGIFPTDLILKELTTSPSYTSIKNCNCDIILMPSVMVDPDTKKINWFESYIPKNITEDILKWSTECPNNLVIASQGETTEWGYSLINSSENSNTSVDNPVLPQIFDGPFGAISQFRRDGDFKGVFKDPIPGSDILAIDERGRPSILLDSATNDILLSDMGIICGDGAGDISKGSMIITKNDILACNIFAIACQVASSTKITNETYEENQTPIMLPDGSLAFNIGCYRDTLETTFGCDSIVNIKIITFEEVVIPNIFSPNGDSQNNYFNYITDAEITVESFKVFNRWGQLIYNNQTPLTGWDGTFKNEAAPVDVYVYQIIYSNSIGTRREIISGDVTLLR